ncbi:MAG: universal stress protein A [Planctomycetota bacterium]|jgi:universal stress protein A
MINIERILWPTDFSDNSKVAQLYACELAKQFGAELHIIHVIIDPAYFMTSMGVGYIPDHYEADIREHSDEELGKLPTGVAVDGLIIIRKTIYGAAAEDITSYANDHGISMIVMGTHGYSGMNRLLLGSVAEKVVRISSCPVLTIHADDNQFIGTE